MFMKEQEIVSSYRQAKSKKHQITILAEINDCERSDIIELLQLNGECCQKSNGYKQLRWTPEECQQLEKLFDEHMTTREIAILYGYKASVMASTVTHLRAQGKLQRRSDIRRGPRPKDLEQIRLV